MDIAALGLSNLSDALSKGTVGAVEAARFYLDRIAVRNKTLNAFITVTDKLAYKQAEESDTRRVNGNTLGPLDGIPLALKDNIDLAGIPTTGGIQAYRNSVPDRDSEVVRRLREAGAVFLGKLNLHEGAHGATTANHAFGYCQNPHKLGYTPGGSSGGSGSALAAGLCAGALGTDTLGSVRIPASFCGIVGLKPTYGLVSTRGVMPLAYALDHVGPMARSTADIALLLNGIAGFDPGDPSGRHGFKGFSVAQVEAKPIRTHKIGYFKKLHGIAGNTIAPEVASAYNRAIELLRHSGAQLEVVSWDSYDTALVRPKALLLIEADLANIHSDKLKSNPEGFTSEFRSSIAFGREQNAPKLAKAMRMIEEVRPIARHLFSKVDALITPTTPIPSFPFDDEMPKTITTYTAFANYAGCPALSVPMGLTKDSLPLGLQIITPKREEMTALQIGRIFENA
ncbi:MAG: amidase [Rhodospirillaceae bacterium]